MCVCVRVCVSVCVCVVLLSFFTDKILRFTEKVNSITDAAMEARIHLKLSHSRFCAPNPARDTLIFFNLTFTLH